MIDPAGAEDLRHVVSAHQLGSGKWHWHAESFERRKAFLADIASASPLTTVVGRTPVRSNSERVRSQLWWSLVPQLHAKGMTSLIVEARQQRLNQRDVHTFSALRLARQLAPTCRFDFVKGSAEPLLWVADAMVGAVGAQLADGDARYTAMLPDCWEVVDG